jgi:uncharacterized membrane protein (UPF0127 family)
MKAINRSKGLALADNVSPATTFFTRLRGLMFRSSLAEGSGLYIAPCNSVHSCFMRFPFDVLFLDSNRRVTGMIEGMQPWKFSKLYRSACEALELPAGTVAKTGTALGDQIHLGADK